MNSGDAHRPGPDTDGRVEDRFGPRVARARRLVGPGAGGQAPDQGRLVPADVAS